MNTNQATVSQIKPFQYKDDKAKGAEVAKGIAIYLIESNIW